VSLVSCEHSAEKNWVDAMKDCGITDINSSQILYFGPSNNVGPGSGWRDTFDANGNHVDYRLRFTADELPAPKDFVQLAAGGYQCRGGRTVNFKLAADVAGSVSTLPLNVQLSNEFQKAKSVTISIGGMGWDQLRELAYETYFRSTLGAGNKFYEDMNVPNRLVVIRALAVRDLVMTYDFSAADAAAIKGKFTGPLAGATTGDIGGGLSANWQSATTLAVTAPQKAWILGELGSFRSGGGFAAAKVGSQLQAVEIKPKSPVLLERLP
jgi:hypothetical protein